MLAYSQVRGEAPHAISSPPEVIRYLADRGINVTLAAELGLKILRAQDLFAAARGTPAQYEDNRYAIVFPHHSPLGFDIDWWSARLVAPDAAPTPKALQLVHSFSAAVDHTAVPSHAGKMFCPPNTPPCAYIPVAPSLPKWDQIPRGSRVFIHESAIKAINGARLGFYSVGLNGVWGWSSRKHGLALLPELRDIPWKQLDLHPIILFDTNIDTSQQVEHAAKSLAAKLFEVTGRTARLLRMTKDHPADPDFGFDDFAVRVGYSAAKDFLETLDEDLLDIEISEIELMKLQLNAECAVVSELGRIAIVENGTLMTRSVFAEVNYATMLATVTDANGIPKPVNVPKLWLQDSRRTEVEGMSYAPGKPSITVEDGKRTLNTWRGWGIQPVAGHVDRWLQLLALNLKSDDLQEWILNWMAYPLQHPGQKLNSLLLMFGPQGTGKDVFLRPLHAIYGTANAVKISNDQIGSTFTSLYAAKQFIHLDELQRAKGSGSAIDQKIKGMVTNPKSVVNRKGEPEYQIRNVSNIAITSNYYDCVKLDEDDRRACVIRWAPTAPENDRRGDSAFWLPLIHWLDHEDGAAQVFHYLLQRDLTGFDPAAWAPSTPWKEAVIDSARTPIERYCAQLREDPAIHLPPLTDGRVLFTSKELAVYHYGEEPSKGQVDALSNELRNHNFVRANNDKYLKTTKSGVQKWWVIPRPELPELAKSDWQKSDVCLAHLKAHSL